MASVAKKTKLESENRNFNKGWTLKYLFILSTQPNSKPMCLLCNESLSVLKEYNVKHHFTTKHGGFGKFYLVFKEKQFLFFGIIFETSFILLGFFIDIW